MTTQKWILLAEDNPQDADLVMRALAQGLEDHRVVVAHDGLEALDCLNHQGNFKNRPEKNPTVILLDLKMPRVDGLEVLRRVKTDDRLRNIPVVMFTSSREESDVETCYRFGANAYVVKPVDFKQFRTAVKEMRAFWLDLNELPPGASQPPVAAAG